MQDTRDIQVAETAVNVVIAVGKKEDASVIRFQILTKNRVDAGTVR